MLPIWPSLLNLTLMDMLPKEEREIYFKFTFCWALYKYCSNQLYYLLKCGIITKINVPNDSLFVEPIECFQFFVLWSCFQLPHICCNLVKISLMQK